MLSVLLDWVPNWRWRMTLLIPRVPETFEEAQRLRMETIMLFNEALLETSPARLAFVIEAVKRRLDMMPLVRAHFDAEIQREMNRVDTEAIRIVASNSLYCPKCGEAPPRCDCFL